MVAPIPFGKYRLLRLLATGGMGEVYEAQLVGPAGYQKPVVIKRILRHLANEQEFISLFQNEARVAALLDHPNIVQIFELGEHDGTYFIAMEWVPGLSVAQLQRRFIATGRRVPPAVAVTLCQQALVGLDYAHRKADAEGRPMGLVHRDVSPDNLLVSNEGVVKLSDFGLAKAVKVARTTRGLVRGKYRYMAPEQLRAEPLDQTCDLYAMGVVLYELLTGAHPFPAPSEPTLIQAVLQAEPVPPRAVDDAIPEALEAIVLKALARAPSDRFQTAEEMRAALGTWLRQHAPEAGAPELAAWVRALSDVEDPGDPARELPSTAPDGPLPSIGEDWNVSSVKRSRAPAVIAAAVLALAGLGGGLLLWRASTVSSTTATGEPIPMSEPSESTALDRDASTAVGGAMAAEEPSAGSAEAPHSRASASVAAVEAPAPAPSRRARASTERRPGRVRFNVYPWAEVYLAGKKLGVTPMEPLTLPPGRHVFVLRNPELKVERRVRVVVTSGREAVVRSDLLSAKR